MGLYQQWQELGNMQQTPAMQQAFWDEYFTAETENYKAILGEKQEQLTGTLKELADRFSMTSVVFTGFLDGINDSLKEKLDLDTLEEDTPLTLNVDFTQLFRNMLNAKAKWLYTLPEWDGILSEEERKNLTREWRASKQAVSEKTVGRNDPCPCGSGKKYKKCCGK